MPTRRLFVKRTKSRTKRRTRTKTKKINQKGGVG